MAKTGIHIKRCNVGSVEAHNLRTKEYLDGLEKAGKSIYFFQTESHNNHSWVNPMYEGKTCKQIQDELAELYREKVGQSPQMKDKVRVNKKTGREYTVAGWSPIREGVVPIKEDTTLKDFWKVMKFAEKKGLGIIRIDIHHDEGYKNEATGETKYNRHAHIIFDWVDHKTGKTRKLDDKDMSEFQDIVAESLQMERGTRKEETGLEHIDHIEYREQRAEAHTIELEKEIEQQGEKIREQEETIEKQEKEIREQEDQIAKNNKEIKILMSTAENNARAAEKALEALEMVLEGKSIAEEEKARIEQNTKQLREELEQVNKKYQEEKEKLIKEGFGVLGSVAKGILGIRDKQLEKELQSLTEVKDEVEELLGKVTNTIVNHPIPNQLEEEDKYIFETLKRLNSVDSKTAIEVIKSARDWGVVDPSNIDYLINGGSLKMPKGVQLTDSIADTLDEDITLSARSFKDGVVRVCAKVGEMWETFRQFLQTLRERKTERYNRDRIERMARNIEAAKERRQQGRGMRR